MKIQRKPASKKKLIVANWKMNPELLGDAKKILQKIKKGITRAKHSDVVFCPPALFLGDLRGKSVSLKTGKVSYGVQNITTEVQGAHTGEISAEMAKSAGVRYAIVGHSERRALGEDDLLIAKKVAAALRADITPILCIGELKRDETGESLQILYSQLKASLGLVAVNNISKVVIAYEPVYAIGAAQAVTPHHVHERNIFIKKVLTELFGKDNAFKVKILYGGSADETNAKALVGDGAVDGLLLGRASVNPETFITIVKEIDQL